METQFLGASITHSRKKENSRLPGIRADTLKETGEIRMESQPGSDQRRTKSEEIPWRLIPLEFSPVRRTRPPRVFLHEDDESGSTLHPASKGSNEQSPHCGKTNRGESRIRQRRLNHRHGYTEAYRRKARISRSTGSLHHQTSSSYDQPFKTPPLSTTRLLYGQHGTWHPRQRILRKPDHWAYASEYRWQGLRRVSAT